jgi:hypothetical protein
VTPIREYLEKEKVKRLLGGPGRHRGAGARRAPPCVTRAREKVEGGVDGKYLQRKGCFVDDADVVTSGAAERRRDTSDVAAGLLPHGVRDRPEKFL